MSKEKVLIVEDEEDILQLLSFNVEAARIRGDFQRGRL